MLLGERLKITVEFFNDTFVFQTLTQVVIHDNNIDSHFPPLICLNVVLASRVASVGIFYILQEFTFLEEGVKELFVLLVGIFVGNKCRYLSGYFISFSIHAISILTIRLCWSAVSSVPLGT